jgi:hypothetical protein
MCGINKRNANTKYSVYSFSNKDDYTDEKTDNHSDSKPIAFPPVPYLDEFSTRYEFSF